MEVIGLQDTLRRLDAVQKSINDPKLRRRVMRKPANIVVKAAPTKGAYPAEAQRG